MPTTVNKIPVYGGLPQCSLNTVDFSSPEPNTIDPISGGVYFTIYDPATPQSGDEVVTIKYRLERITISQVTTDTTSTATTNCKVAIYAFNGTAATWALIKEVEFPASTLSNTVAANTQELVYTGGMIFNSATTIIATCSERTAVTSSQFAFVVETTSLDSIV